MRVLCVVPARGGSKRCPRKNIAELGGQPLLIWTLRTARDCGVFDQVIVTTDDAEIADTADTYWGSKISWERPNYLARDDTPMLPVIHDVFSSNPADIVVTLQPTSPFRTVEDIKAGLALMTPGTDSVFSVTAAPEDLVFEIGHAQRLRPLVNVVVPNGALFIITGAALERGLSWFDGMAYGYTMPKDRSLDIDTELDLEVARMIASKQQATCRAAERYCEFETRIDRK